MGKSVIEWTGKEILFPDSMRLVDGGMIAKPDADFTIVSYYAKYRSPTQPPGTFYGV
ncbi:MAG: hypothetical protein K2F94_09205 [Muribaculaceae bacterium]|nr:hypothetical protein [Muribaculaceae bacterium]